MTIDGVGEIRWDARHARVGTHRVEVVVSDLHGGEARQTFEVAIRESDPASEWGRLTAPGTAAVPPAQLAN
jgi:hypothetical protein